jgi:heme exporter protein A
MRGERILFEHLRFALDEGALLRIEGANGSGKSSLLRIICGLMPPAQGEVHWRGQSIGALREDYRKHIVYIGHLDALKNDLTALENLEISAALAGREIRRDAAQDALQELGIAQCAHVPARMLSQGQRRRLALARLAISKALPVWLLDEPFTALDAAAVNATAALISEHVKDGGIAIYTTHQGAAIEAGIQHRIDLGGTC